MTTPQTPAGWYPDPDGRGGQRYWDGSAWTENRSPAAQPTVVDQPTVVVPTRPVPHGSEQPPVVASMRPPSAEEPVGAHRAPEPGTEREPAPGDNRKLILWFSAACAALLAVLVLVVVYGVFIQDDESIQIASPTSSPAPTAEDATETRAPGLGEPTAPATETDAPVEGEAADGPLSFAVAGVETGATVSSTDAPVEKTAQGEYIVVRMSVINTGDAPAQFLGILQKLHAGGTTYTIDDEATFYVGGGFVEIPPGGQALVGVAYDVPPGTVAESIELHTDPLSPGVQLPL